MLPSKHTPCSSRKRSHEQDPVVSDDEDNEVPLLSRDAAQALAKATGLLTKVWEKKVLDKDVVSTVYTAFQKDHKPIVDEIKDHMQKHVANFEMVPEKMFDSRLMKKFNNHKQTIRSGKKGKRAASVIDAASDDAAASENVNPNQAADQSTSVSANAAEAPTSRN